MSGVPTCPCEGRTLDRHLQPTVLALLVEGPQHGYALAEQLAGSPLLRGRKPDLPGVYRALATMEKMGLVEHQLASSPAGPAKRVYALTAKGLGCLGEWCETLATYRDRLGELVETLRVSHARGRGAESELPVQA